MESENAAAQATPQYDEKVLLRQGFFVYLFSKPARLQLTDGVVSLIRKDNVLFSVAASNFDAAAKGGWQDNLRCWWDINVNGQIFPISFSFGGGGGRGGGDFGQGVTNRDRFIALMQQYNPVGLPKSPSGDNLNADEIATDTKKMNTKTRTVIIFAVVAIGLLYIVSMLVGRH